ncbi:phospholipase A2 [Deinococcus sp.]|uniref:phospholipase A2 n=1 Tax=Deinococcus sp. TaxID=47478 RepID=UPI0025E57FA8|nr:phospholipase A2 [Deinococcus sp.]
MKRPWCLSLLTLATLLTACRPEPLPDDRAANDRAANDRAVNDRAATDYASRSELQDAQSQFILAQVGHDPRLIATLQEAYGEAPAPQAPNTQALPAPVGRLEFVKSLAWGNVQNFEAASFRRDFIDTLHPGLDWSTDGCSTPPGLDFGYHETFRPACLVHDFGYHNLRLLERTPENRTRTDEAFFSNLKAICAARFPPERPSCYVVAYMYEEGVRLGGAALF